MFKNFIVLKSLRKIYLKLFKENIVAKPQCEENPDAVSSIIYQKLINDKPCMIARFGAFELSTVVNYLGVKNSNKNVISYIKGNGLQWWWNEKLLASMENNAGFFPPTKEKISEFSELMLADMKDVDVLGSWLKEENYFLEELKDAIFVQREIQNPFFTKNPWTKALKGNKVLVIHPFADLIVEQYKKRKLLFSNEDILPEFDLRVIASVQSMGGSNQYKDWFEALESMKSKMDTIDYDICLIGAGAYGFPLAAHAKRMGKKAIHLGGALQLLFGIKGKRWENPNYNKEYNYASLINEYWVRPGNNLKPKNSDNVEGGCYW